MKKISVTLLTLISAFAFAQEKEIKSAFDAFESGNKPQAETLINQATNLIGEKSINVDPEVYAKYLYVKGLTLLDKGNNLEAAKDLAELNSYEKGPIYSSKNKDTKEKVFFLDKEEAEKYIASGKFSPLKEVSSGTSLNKKTLSLLDAKIKSTYAEAQEANKAKNYEKAADKFLETYYLFKAAGMDEQSYEYYAAVTYHMGNLKEKAAPLYLDLIKSGYNGVQETYKATREGSEVTFPKEQLNLIKLDKSYSNIHVEKSPSIEPELYRYTIGVLSDLNKDTDALALAEKGSAKFPADKDISDLLGSLYYKTGQADKYIAKLQQDITKNPNDYLSYYNLGVVYSKDTQNHQKAIDAYKKAIEIKPDYTATYLNLASILLTPDKEIVEQMKKLGSTKADNAKYEELIGQRKEIFKQALPYLEKAYQINPKDYEVVSALEEAYRTLGMREKLMEIRKIKAGLTK